MPLDTLSIDVTSTNEGRTQIFVLHGSLDLATSPSLRAALLDATEREAKYAGWKDAVRRTLT